jgi:hypothetical protein
VDLLGNPNEPSWWLGHNSPSSQHESSARPNGPPLCGAAQEVAKEAMPEPHHPEARMANSKTGMT